MVRAVSGSERKVWSFGYNLRHDCWGKGYATEAAKRMINYVYSEKNAREFVSEHAVENHASGRVIEKCGLTFDGIRNIPSLTEADCLKVKNTE